MPSASPHRSTRRQRQAEATRRDVLAAARRLFAERGFRAASIADIAREADVAVPTVYASVGSKQTLVVALNDLIDEQAEVGPIARRLAQAEDPLELVALAVRLTRQLNERCGDIIGAMVEAAPGEADAAAALRDGLERHHQGARRTAARLGELGHLREGMAPERADDMIALLTSPQTYAQLTRDYGWSFDECEEWLGVTLGDLLLQDDSAEGA